MHSSRIAVGAFVAVIPPAEPDSSAVRAGTTATSRARRIVVTVAAVIGAATACGTPGVDAVSAPDAPSAAQGQSDLRDPVPAVSHDPTRPVSVTIGDATAPTDAVATDSGGVLLPPTDVARLGWWVDSTLPGTGSGVVVVTGHIDDLAQGTGYAARFAELDPGAVVTLTGDDGSRHDYRVTRVDQVDKEGGLPVDELNRTDGPETLALVTCGGEFVGPPLGYADNTVVFAEPA